MPNVDTERIEELIHQRDVGTLESLLQDTSNLPGPRGNLEVAAAVATAMAREDAAWASEIANRWSNVDQHHAGGNEPGVMLPFTAPQVAGALWMGTAGVQRTTAESILRSAANDPRWRVREGGAMGLQRIGFADFDALRSLIQQWQRRATLFEHRAIVAGLAEPSLISTHEHASYGLDCAMTALDAMLIVPVADRKADDVRALRKALGYALSVFIASNPQGFTQLERVARIEDKDASWIVRENLTKARIAKHYPTECAAVAAVAALLA